MCGIAGIISHTPGPEVAKRLERMSACIRHRGPDAARSFVENGAALAHRRLAIIDLSEDANQPLFDPSGRYCILLNGEIYNHRELRAGLRGYEFRTDADSEVALAAFLKHGIQALDMLSGMFALAIWDREARRLFLARDRFGVKPLYYTLTADNDLVFASEIRAVLASGYVEGELDNEALRDYLMFQSVYSPRTIVKNIRQLGAGEYATFEGGNLNVRNWWRIDSDPSRIDDDREAVTRHVRDLMERSVERRLVSDVPVGVFLSGGIDSSALVALMSEISSGPVHTFSAVFGEEEYDESRYSNIVATRFGTDHTQVRSSAGALLDDLPGALAAMDSPSGDGINTYLVAKAAREAGIKVALSGIGGDEVFAGYHYFDQWRRARTGVLSAAPAVLRRLAVRFVAGKGPRPDRIREALSAETLDIASLYPNVRQVLSTNVVNAYLGKGNGQPAIGSALLARMDAIDRFPLLSQFTIADLTGYTQNVLLKDIDQFSMASALEVREPFLDHELVSYVLRVPDRMKTGRQPKDLLVRALGDLLPREIVDRPKKGFVLPLDQWMKNELRSFCEDRIESLAARGYLDPDRLGQNWRLFLSGHARWSELWHIITLSSWLETNGL